MKLLLGWVSLVCTVQLFAMESQELENLGFSKAAQREAYHMIKFDNATLFDSQSVYCEGLSLSEQLDYINQGYNFFKHPNFIQSYLLKQRFLAASIGSKCLLMNHHQIYLKTDGEHEPRLVHEIQLEPRSLDTLDDIDAVKWPRRFLGLVPNEQGDKCLVSIIEIADDEDYVDYSLALLDLPE